MSTRHMGRANGYEYLGTCHAAAEAAFNKNRREPRGAGRISRVWATRCMQITTNGLE
jgi:hypothetical protein